MLNFYSRSVPGFFAWKRLISLLGNIHFSYVFRSFWRSLCTYILSLATQTSIRRIPSFADSFYRIRQFGAARPLFPVYSRCVCGSACLGLGLSVRRFRRLCSLQSMHQMVLVCFPNRSFGRSNPTVFFVTGNDGRHPTSASLRQKPRLMLALCRHSFSESSPYLVSFLLPLN